MMSLIVEPPALEPFNSISGPSARASEGQAEGGEVLILLTSLGGSTGTAFEAYAFNTGSTPVRLEGEGLALEPLDADAAVCGRQWLEQQLSNVTERLAPTSLDAYCLEFLRDPPQAGRVFKLAACEIREQFAPARRILRGFERAFLDRTRENLRRMGQAWTGEIEKAVRSIVPGRWRDITQVLEEADLVPRRRTP
jgi:hypothetical protein